MESKSRVRVYEAPKEPVVQRCRPETPGLPSYGEIRAKLDEIEPGMGDRWWRAMNRRVELDPAAQDGYERRTRDEALHLIGLW